MENQNKYYQIDHQKKSKDYPVENNGNFQNILKLLTEQRSKIDEMLIKTRNYQVTRQRNVRTGTKDSETIDDINFLEDISGFQNGASQNAQELRKKIDTLKKRHKSDMNGSSQENQILQYQMPKKKNANKVQYQQKFRDSNMISPQKEQYNITVDNTNQPINNYLKNYDLNNLQSNKSQQRTLSLHNNQQPIEQGYNDHIDQQQIKIQIEQRNVSNPNIYSGNPQLTNPSEHVYLPPISQSVNQSVDLSRRQQRSNSICYKTQNGSYNREQLNKSDLGMINTEQDQLHNNTMPNQIIKAQNNINTRGVRLNTQQKNILSGYKIDNNLQKYKSQIKSNQIKKIYLQNPLSQKVQYFNQNATISPEKRDLRDSFMNDFNRVYNQNNMDNSKIQKKTHKKYSNKKQSSASILDQDIFNMHKRNESIPSLDINTTEPSQYYNNSQFIVNTNYDLSTLGQIPQGLNNINYYSDFEQLIKRQSMETLSILEHVFETSKSKTKAELLEKLSEFKQNFTVHAEKQDKQLRDIKKKYHHFKKFDLPRDYNLINQTF